MTTSFFRRSQSVQRPKEKRNLFVSLDPQELFLGDEKPRAYPALPLVARMSSLTLVPGGAAIARPIGRLAV
jgi:hypothetical protein